MANPLKEDTGLRAELWLSVPTKLGGCYLLKQEGAKEMRTLEELAHVIVGGDLGMGVDKPVAAVAVGFWPNGKSVVLDWADAKIEKGDTFVFSLISRWEWEVVRLVEIQQQSGLAPVYVVCEQATARGKFGWKLQALAYHLGEVCKTRGVTFLPPIAPTRLKKAVTGSGKSDAEEVAQVIRDTVINGDMLPTSAGFDWEAAVGAAIAGDKELRGEKI